MINNYMERKLDKSFDNEIWKSIKGYPGYLVSDHGRIKSIKFGKEKILKQRINRNGYSRVTLSNNGKIETKDVHRLVLEAFVGNPGGKLECNHRNGIKSDNRLSNLEWVTRSENIIHAYETGLRNTKGENCNLAKLTESEVFEICEMYNSGVSQREIAAKFNVSRRCISHIITGKTWKHLTGITRSKPHSKNAIHSIPITINLNFWLAREAI